MSTTNRATERDNVTVWDGSRRGWYEVYYLKLNVRETGEAFWIRYTLLSPEKGHGSPVAELWAIAFDPRESGRNLALKRTVPIAEARIERAPFGFGVGNAQLRHDAATGSLEGRAGKLEWNLAWDPPAETFRHFPHEAMYRLALPKTKVLVPNQDVSFRGTIRWNDRVVECRGEPGQQTHIWGTKHADRWVWGHGNAFEGVDASFECLSARIRIGPLVTPDLVLLFLRRGGRWCRLNSLWQAVMQKTEADLPVFRFRGEGEGIRLSGEASARIGDFIGVEYTDPDGEHLWCYNTKVADLRLDVEDDGRSETLHARRTFALEFVQRVKDPRIPIRI
ncbi:MAG: hypothetical protein HY905_11380 [Deltaproteobacteria bacterium]|nr:hypothetical protein [Deltaproteobacteria bacterium]